MNFINFFIFQIYIFTFSFFKSYHGKNKNLKKSTPQWNPIEVCKFLFFTSHTIGNPKSTDVNTNWNNAIGGLLKITSGKWIRLCGTTVNKYVKNNANFFLGMSPLNTSTAKASKKKWNITSSDIPGDNALFASEKTEDTENALKL